MASDAIRGLYLTVGVQTRPAMSALRSVRAELDKTDASALKLLGTLKNISAIFGGGAGGMGPLISSSKALASNMTVARTQAQQMATSLNRQPGGMGAGAMGAGGTGGSSRLGFIGRAIERSLAVTGVYALGRGVESLSDSEYRGIRAASVSGTSRAEQFGLQRSLMRNYNMRASEASALGLAAAQIGIRGPQGAALTEAAAAFSRVEPGVAAEDAAKAAYRLTVATHGNPNNYRGVMSAILKAGDVSPAGPEEVFEMMRGLQSAFSIGRFTSSQGIGLASALAGFDPEARESARGSIIRMFASPKVNALAMSLAARGGLAHPGQASGGEVLSSIGHYLSGISPEQRIAAMGQLSNVRDRKFLSDLANTIQEFGENTKFAADEIANNGKYLDTQIGEYRDSTKGKIDALKSSFDAFGQTILGTVGPALTAVLSGATAMLSLIAENAASALMLTGGGLLFAGRRTAIGRGITGFFGGARARYAAGVVDAGVNMAGSRMPGRALGFAEGTFGTRLGSSLMRIPGAQSIFGALGTPLGEVPGLGRVVTGLGERLGERGMMGLAGRGMMSAAEGPVGWIAMAVGMLQPVFQGISVFLRDIGKRGGLVGFLANSLSMLFSVISAIGKGINAVMDGLGKAIEWFFNLPVIKQVTDFVGGVMGGVSDFLNGLGGSGGRGPMTVTNNTYNVKVGSAAKFEAKVNMSASKALRGQASHSYAGGS